MRMRITLILLALICLCANAIADTFGTGANQFEIEFVEIGDPGNTADTSGKPSPAGAVDYVYNIGKFEISREVIEKANAEGDLGIDLHPMDFVSGGPRAAMPATGVSWNEGARFANWLNTSQGLPAAYKFNTQPGDRDYDANANVEHWTNGDPGFDAANPIRNSLAKYFLPGSDEWYKAAYYDPDANGGDGGYWNFPTGSDTPPTAVASGTAPNTAVYSQTREQGPADITKAGGLSPYGVMGLGGNVWEWERASGSAVRNGRGGGWESTSGVLDVSDRPFFGPPTGEAVSAGFRIVSVPEPSSLPLGFLGILGLLLRHSVGQHVRSPRCRSIEKGLGPNDLSPFE